VARGAAPLLSQLQARTRSSRPGLML